MKIPLKIGRKRSKRRDVQVPVDRLKRWSGFLALSPVITVLKAQRDLGEQA